MYPFWVELGCWCIGFQGRFSPKETLKTPFAVATYGQGPTFRIETAFAFPILVQLFRSQKSSRKLPCKELDVVLAPERRVPRMARVNWNPGATDYKSYAQYLNINNLTCIILCIFASFGDFYRVFRRLFFAYPGIDSV